MVQYNVRILFKISEVLKMDFKYKISVIVPIYNVEEYLDYCLESLVKQTIDKSQMEVLLVNDGSPDNSEAICKKFCAQYSFFKYFAKENEGVSKTRNFGIKHAQGKYIAYLDPDDALTENSLENLVSFFDKHEDDVDIITYKIVPMFEGKSSGPLHHRYKILKHSGIYDLTCEENAFVTQTTMNICVKNKGEDNILFHEDTAYHEDQRYNIDVVRNKMKIGYCTGAQYLYTKNPSSVTNTRFYAYYIFEDTMKYWEDLFASFNGNVPQYIQAMYVNDLIWKIQGDLLLPYHYRGEDFDNAVNRICVLLRSVADTVIMKHPNIDSLHVGYLLGLKYNNKLDVTTGSGGAVVSHDGNPLIVSNAFALVVCRFKVDNEKVYIDAFLRTPITSYTDNVEIFANLTGEDGAEKIALKKESSAWDHYRAKIKTNRFFRVRFDWDYKKYPGIQFSADICGTSFPTRLDFVVHAPFNTGILRSTLFRCGYKFVQGVNGFDAYKSSSAEEKVFTRRYMKTLMLRKPRTFLWRMACGNIDPSKRKIWLYYDCKNVYKDNGYYQFIHDFDKDDGVERYYVVNDKMDRKALFTPKQRKHIISFGSLEHRRYYLAAEKIITAYAEHNNYNPFPAFVWKLYTDLFKAEVIYLQHGVLHAYLPWKYANDRLTAFDKEVVSTSFEMRNFTENYGFRECDLIPAGMPRYDFIDIEAAKSEKKILFAPTWRKYLVGMDKDGSFFATPDKFKNSDFYKETYKFLTSKELEEVLEKNDWYLDFKLHPIFRVYNDLYDLKSERIRIADNSVDEKSYKVFITDFSSFCFDFVYLKKTMMYFVPDDEMFRAGMNDYRKLDLPLEDGFGPLAHSADEALRAIIDLVERNGEAEPVYQQKMDSMFLHADTNCRERIYQAIK